MKRLLTLTIILLIFSHTYAQDTLPNFTLTERGGKVIISWVNPYPAVIQLNVQRSYDSIRYFQTVFSAVSPELPQNGYSETKMPTNRIFYRIFYVLAGGSYYFTKSQRVGAYYQTQKVVSLYSLGNSQKSIKVKMKDSIYAEFPAARFRVFRDSILRNTKDTLYAVSEDLVMYARYVGPDYWRASSYIFTSRDGITISLPNTSKKYSAKFFDESGSPIFEIKHIKESPLILDKANFFHAGWFLFELYEDGALKEKNKFFLSKEF